MKSNTGSIHISISPSALSTHGWMGPGLSGEVFKMRGVGLRACTREMGGRTKVK
jgi:hypothetical protein